ncbi:hypothetical protein ANN_18904 [Periplaneta americana]|uniref:Uncharacterized protein n=1 Tax=Periplaneta americana TaxID=6978 RepID=A0ABQ8SQ07_PERAM|nr:hypothetical protein ANN_18904 [Periplaneta americana]
MAGLCEGGNEPPDSLKASNHSVSKPEQAIQYRSSTRVWVRNCVSIRRPEFECSGPQLEGPEFECSGPQLEGPEFEYSGLSLKQHSLLSHIVNIRSLKYRNKSFDIRFEVRWFPFRVGVATALENFNSINIMSRAVASSKASCLGLALRNARWFESSRGRNSQCMGPVPTQHRDALGEL